MNIKDNIPILKEDGENKKDKEKLLEIEGSKEFNLENKRLYNFKVNEISYTIYLKVIQSKLRILVLPNKIEEQSDYKYSKDFTLEEFKKINKIFRLYDNIEDTIEFFDTFFTDKKNLSKLSVNVDSFQIIIKTNVSKSEKQKKESSFCINIPKIERKKSEKEIKEELIPWINEKKIDLEKDKKYIRLLLGIGFDDQIKAIKEENESLKKRVNVLEYNNNKFIEFFKEYEKTKENQIHSLEEQLSSIFELFIKLKEKLLKEYDDNQLTSELKHKLEQFCKGDIISSIKNQNINDLKNEKNNLQFKEISGINNYMKKDELSYFNLKENNNNYSEGENSKNILNAIINDNIDKENLFTKNIINEKNRENKIENNFLLKKRNNNNPINLLEEENNILKKVEKGNDLNKENLKFIHDEKFDENDQSKIRKISEFKILGSEELERADSFKKKEQESNDKNNNYLYSDTESEQFIEDDIKLFSKEKSNEKSKENDNQGK